MYSASTPNKRLKFLPPPSTPSKECPTKSATSWRPRPRPPPAVKLKRLKSDCAEADAMSPQKANKKSIRFLNLDLLIRRPKLVKPKVVEPRSSTHSSTTIAVFTYDARAENESQPFSRPSVAPGGRPGRGVHLPVKHRPVLAEHVSTRSGCQVQTIAKERISDGAVPIRPVYVRQSLRH